MLEGAVNNLLDCDHGGDESDHDIVDYYDDVCDDGDDNYDDNDEAEYGVRAQGCCEE